MKRLISILLAVIIFGGALFVPTFAQSSKGVKEEYINQDKWLTLSKNKEGARYFVDTKGNPVNLFGMARCQHHANEEDVLYSTKDDGIDSLAKHYADYGCNFMRLSIYMPELCGGEKKTPQKINDFINEKIDPDVQAIIRSGMYVMLDIHMYPEPAGERTARTLVQFARDYYLPVLVELAKKYKDEPMVAVYELWNEPYPADISAPPPEDKEGDWATQVRSFFMDAVDEIRKIDTKHVIMVSDHNAGWGCAITDLWNGYYKKLDPTYQNTCFSVHVAAEQLDESFDFYSNWWKITARSNNICLLFGEIETEGNLATEKGMKNLFNYFSATENEYHFSGVLWRPHGEKVEYSHLWAHTGWADKYCNFGPFPQSRYAIETEDLLGYTHDNVKLSKDVKLFGTQMSGTGISLKPNLKSEYFYETTNEVITNYAYKKGKYKLVVRALGKNNNTGDFIVGYKDVSGTVHQIARFSGKNSESEVYYQTVEFTADKNIVSFAFFGCEKSKSSVFIDRIYLIGANDDVIIRRYNIDVPDANKVVFLNGKTAKVKVKTPKIFEYGDLEDTEGSTDNKSKVEDKNEKHEDTKLDDENKKEPSKKEKNESSEKSKSKVNIQFVDSKDDDIDENDLDFGEIKNKKNGVFTPVVIIILIVAMCIWLGLIVAVIIYKIKKKNVTETED